MFVSIVHVLQISGNLCFVGITRMVDFLLSKLEVLHEVYHKVPLGNYCSNRVISAVRMPCATIGAIDVQICCSIMKF